MNASKTILWLVILTASTGISSFAQEFTLTTSQSNIISSRASIGRPGLDGNPQAIIVATPLGDADKNNPHPLGAWYYKDKWNIFNTDHVVMPVNMRYKIESWPERDANHFLHILTPQNIGDEGSYLDHPLLNGHPNAYFKILQNYTPDDRPGFYLNANEAKPGYNSASGRWYIANVNGKRLYPGTAYSVAIFSDGTESTTAAAETVGLSKPGTARTPEPQVRPAQEAARSTASSQPEPQRTREPIANTTTGALTSASPTTGQLPDPVGAPPIERPSRGMPVSQSGPSGGPCTDEDAYRTLGKWGKQRPDDLAMADRSFPKEKFAAVLAKAQKVIDLFMRANPGYNGIEASAYRGIRGDPLVPGGPVPFRVDVRYKSFICVGNDTASVDKRGKVILYGNYGVTTVSFNGLRDVFGDSVLLTNEGEEIFELKKQLGDFKGMTMIEPFMRDGERHEAVIITRGGQLPYKPVTREQFLQARIKHYRTIGGNFDSMIAALNNAISNMSAADRQSPAIVRDMNATPGVIKLFATEGEGGRHLVTIDKGYLVPAPLEAIQLITVHWYWTETAPPKAQMIRSFKQNFDFEALKQMLGK